ncbi:MAG: HAMP domain-containing histidine kinase [Proteobacteria bacterium]|jgi:signal transduction histidine kinase|nr:HAMP domain-containing histidine kinase [Pseudomonadota bacterium]
MSRASSLGLRARILFALAVVLALFIVLTDAVVLGLGRVSLSRSATAATADDGSIQPDKAKPSVEAELGRLRRLVLFYMITGAAVALALSYFALSRFVVRPLGRVTRAVEEVAEGRLEAETPITGSGEIVELAVSFNRMTCTLRAQRAELKAQLEAIEKSAAELRGAQDQLIRAAKLASVGTLAAGVAHEIGNPLAGVLGLLDALDGEADPAISARYRELIRKEVRRIDRIIADLLAYARPARGEVGERETCRVADAIDHVRALLGAQKLFDGVSLTAEVDAAEPVAMSRDDLTQLLVNLLLNAAQAMGGKGAIAIRAEVVDGWRPQMGVVARRAVALSVTDDGPGIPPEIADRIFDPFFTTKAEVRGSGLGLAICQSICDRVGAEITLDRAAAKGARFVVSIPVA